MLMGNFKTIFPILILASLPFGAFAGPLQNKTFSVNYSDDNPDASTGGGQTSEQCATSAASVDEPTPAANPKWVGLSLAWANNACSGNLGADSDWLVGTTNPRQLLDKDILVSKMTSPQIQIAFDTKAKANTFTALLESKTPVAIKVLKHACRLDAGVGAEVCSHYVLGDSYMQSDIEIAVGDSKIFYPLDDYLKKNSPDHWDNFVSTFDQMKAEAESSIKAHASNLIKDLSQGSSPAQPDAKSQTLAGSTTFDPQLRVK